MNILITGATGFIGSHLAKTLFQQNFKVSCIVRPSSREDAVKQLCTWAAVYTYDGTGKSLLNVLDKTSPEVIIHVASLFLSQHKFSDIDLLIDSNIKFPTQLLEAACVKKVPYFINTGTSWQHYENSTYDPVNLYSATKQAFEDVLEFYKSAYGIRAITLKLFDTYGPRDPRKKLFYLLREAARSGTPLKMSRGEQLINLVFIDDVVRAYITAAELLKNGASGTYFVGNNDLLSLREIVQVYSEQVKKPLRIEWGALPYRPREVMNPLIPFPCIPKWEPCINLDEGIRLMECDPSIRGLLSD